MSSSQAQSNGTHPPTGTAAHEDEPPPSTATSSSPSTTSSNHPPKQSSASKRRQRKKNLVQNQRMHTNGVRITKPVISKHIHVTPHVKEVHVAAVDVHVHVNGIVTHSPRSSSSSSSSGSSASSSPVSTTSSIASSLATSPSYSSQQIPTHSWNTNMSSPSTTTTTTQPSLLQIPTSPQQQQQQQSQQQPQTPYRYPQVHPFPMPFYHPMMLTQHVMVPTATLPLPHPMVMPWYTPQPTSPSPSPSTLGYSRSWSGLPPPAMTSPTRPYMTSPINGRMSTPILQPQLSPPHQPIPSSPFTTPTKSPPIPTSTSSPTPTPPSPETITQPSIIKHKHTTIPSLSQYKLTSQPYDYYCVLDFEATCEQNFQYYQHEIIEFPVVFVNSKTLQIDYEFHSYVRPVLHPELTPFCTRLTGIQQSDVATAPILQSVIQSFEQFCLQNSFFFPGQRSLQKSHRHTYSSVCTTSTQPPQPTQQDDIMVNNRAPNARSCCFVTDGPWDFLSFLEPECALKQVPLSPIYHHFIDLRQMFSSFYACKRTGIKGMLQRIGMTFQGREHSGLADSRNIARIAIHLLQQGCLLTTNLSIYP